MKRPEALKLLGLDRSATALTPEIVKTAFRAEAKRVHPDSPSRTMQEPAADLELLTIARDFLLENLTADDSACVLCRGRGIVPQGMGWLPCVACKGTGVRQ